MIATLEQIQSDLLNAVRLAQEGEEVIITSGGRPVAKLSGLPAVHQGIGDRQTWLRGLRGLRQITATGKTGLTVEQILDEDRGD